jgi:hypothetical protein
MNCKLRLDEVIDKMVFEDGEIHITIDKETLKEWIELLKEVVDE